MIWEEPEVKDIPEYEQLVKWDESKQDYVTYDGELEIAVKTVQANYTIALDTSGLGADWNRITVWHNVKKKMVAAWGKKNLSEEYLAQVAVEIAKYYNYGMIAPETNFSHSIVDYILDLGYDNIYITENLSRVDRKKEAIEYGWKTTNQSKKKIN